jgi:hypothetical protein
MTGKKANALLRIRHYQTPLQVIVDVGLNNHF